MDIIKVKADHEGGALVWQEQCPYKRIHLRALSLSTKWEHSEQAEAVSKEEALPRTEYLAS